MEGSLTARVDYEYRVILPVLDCRCDRGISPLVSFESRVDGRDDLPWLHARCGLCGAMGTEHRDHARDRGGLLGAARPLAKKTMGHVVGST